MPRDLVVIEIATGFWDVYSPGALLGADELIDNGQNVAIIANHNGDSLANVFSNSRNSFYNITGFPTAKFDGIISYVGGNPTNSLYEQYLPLVTQRNNQLSDFTINLQIVATTKGNYRALATIEKVGIYAGTNLVLHFFVTESMLDINYGLGDYVNHVNRMMIPDQNGSSLDFSGGNIQTFEIDFSTQNSWVPENCKLIGFIQDNNSKEILQGTSIPLNSQQSFAPPQNFTAAFVESNGVECAWDAPSVPKYWIGWDNGINSDGLGMNGGGTFWGAAHWKPADLAAYNGWYLTQFEFFPRLFLNAANMKLMIWEDPNATNLIYEQVLTGLAWNEWNLINLDFAHMIDASTDLWLGIEVTHVDAEYPFGYDGGPAVAGYGDMISLNGTTWESMSTTYGINHNFNIKGFVTNVIDCPVGSKKVISQSPIKNTNGELVAGNLKPAEHPLNSNGSRDVLGYNVYRNGLQVNPEPVLGLTMTDPFFSQGTFTYHAKAIYTQGLSDASNAVVVEISAVYPDIEVAPASLAETHDNPPLVTTQTLTIFNSGDAPLHWEMATSTLNFSKNKNPQTDPEAAARVLAERMAAEGIQNCADVQQGVSPGASHTAGNHYTKYISSDASRGVLWDNGPLVTAEGVGSGGSDYCELQDASLGMGTYGFGAQLTAGNSIADDFDVVGDWNVNSFTFFAYQTGSGPPSTLTGVYVQVYDGDPSAGGSLICGDLTTNRLLSTEWTNAWRVLESAPAETRPIMNIVADALGLSLSDGTYWVEMSLTGSGASGPWAPPVTLVGETTTGNSIQKTSTGWAPLVDIGPQGLPFIVEGTTGGPPANDVGVFAIPQPVSGVDLTNTEPVTITIKNSGTAAQSNVPYMVTWDGPTGSQTVNGIFTGSIAAGTAVDVTLSQTADLSVYGDYSFEACTQLASDEYAGNDCKTTTVTNAFPAYCDASTSTNDEYIANVLCGSINNSSGWQGGVADYTAFTTAIAAGAAEAITITNGNAWASDIVTCWVDWNMNYTFEQGTDEEFFTTNVGGTGLTFTGEIAVPAGTPDGNYRMRVRMTYSTPPVPCGNASYGEIEEYTIQVVGGAGSWVSVNLTGGTISPGGSQLVTVTFNSNNLVAGTYSKILNISSNDPDEPFVSVPVSLTVNELPPLIPDFSADPLAGTAPLLVSFTDLSSGSVMMWEWDFDDDGIVDSYDTNPLWEYTEPGTYSVTLAIYDLMGGSATEIKDNFITVLPGESHYTPIWTSPYNPMTFYILAATIDELPMLPGDEVGLFDTDPVTGDEICVGAGVLTEELTGGVYLEIIASMDDGSNPEQANGFTPGHSIIYKLWNEAVGDITSISANYPYPGYDEVFTSQGSAFVELDGVTSITQCIGLTTGWNIMSFRAMPENPDMLNVLETLINNNTLYKVLDEAGGSVFHLPFPPPNGQWSNTIGNLQSTEGYYVKVTGGGELCVTGQPVETPLEIPLSAGWNLISYPCEYAQNALDALQPLIDQEVLYKVIDEAGGTVFHLPFPPPNGQWSNTIGNFESGEGYYVKVTAAAMLTIACPDGETDLMTYFPEITEPVYFHPVYENNPYMPMHIVLNPCEDLKNGDEIAVFDGSICVGAVVYDGDSEMPLVIRTSQNDSDTETPNGFTVGDDIQLMAWNSQTGEVSEAGYEYIEGSQTFAPLETMIGALKMVVTGDDVITGMLQPKVIPNPFAQKTNVLLFMQESGDVMMSIRNMNGKSMQEFPSQILNEGQHTLEIDLRKLGSGVYFLMIDIETDKASKSYMQKLIKL
ncbi:MAG: T9SS type A sorting domain-containing protein [Bacteroidales bacterium]|nr:T9SS type A sorting domain-containing protein [Bacteroidales bacterium]